MIRFALAALLTAVFAAPLHAAIDIKEVTSPGGIEAWLVEDHSIPFAAIEIRFRGGGSLDREGKRGAVNLMTGLLEEGAGDMDAQAFAAARDALAASFGFDSHLDAVSVSARFLTENRDEAMALLREALVNPRFDQEAVDRVRGQVLSGLRSEATDPNTMASRAFYGMAFGTHPYGSDMRGTLESVAALTRDDVVNAYQDALARDRLYVGATGDITAQELGVLLDELLGDLPDTGAPLPGPVEVSVTGGVTVIPFETPQSVVFFGDAGIPRDDPDFFAAFVADAILGGSGRQSRLSTEVREKRGLTYGVGTALVNFDLSDILLGQFASANDRVGQAIGIVRDEWAKIAEEGVTDAELEEAKTYLTGAYPLRFDGNGTIARILVGMQMDGLTPAYVIERNDMVNAVTAEDIRRVAQRLYRPDNLRFVVVGQPEGVESVN